MHGTIQQGPGRPNVTLVLGGARSGKSHYAQQFASKAARVLFIATATAVDDEMRDKIARHRQDRLRDSLTHWTVVEETLKLAESIHQHGPTHELILIDCLTLYVSNLLPLPADAIAANIHSFVEALTHPPCPVVLVSNEVGSGVVPAYASGRQYRDLLGELNQRIAALASDAVLMVAGLPLALKSSKRP